MYCVARSQCSCLPSPCWDSAVSPSEGYSLGMGRQVVCRALEKTSEIFVLKKFCLLFRAWGHQRRQTSKKEWKKERVSCISGNALRESSSVKLIFVNRLSLYTNPVWSPHLSSCSTTTSYWPILLPSAPRGWEMFLLTYEGSSSLPDVCY